LAFADQLEAALGLTGFSTSIDRHGISPGEDWMSRLGALIRDADTVVFVLSPSSARSHTAPGRSRRQFNWASASFQYCVDRSRA
jgi:TIR domain